jgi:hypothetical protein
MLLCWVADAVLLLCLLLPLQVMSVIMQELGIPIPVYTRTDRVQLSHTVKLSSSSSSSSSSKQQADEESSDEEDTDQQRQQGPQDMNGVSVPAAAAGAYQDSLRDTAALAAGADNTSNAAADTAADSAAANGTSSSSGSSWSFTFSINSLHGLSCPLPMVASASVSFLGDAAAAGLKPRQLSGQLPWRLTRSCPAGLQQVQLQVQFALVEAADEGRRSAMVSWGGLFVFCLC